MGKFVKAKSEQAYFKVAPYGKTGSGKTLTSLLWAEGLAAREGKRVAFIDTERGSEFYSIDIPERTVHPKAFDFDRLIMRSLMETLEAFEEIAKRQPIFPSAARGRNQILDTGDGRALSAVSFRRSASK